VLKKVNVPGRIREVGKGRRGELFMGNRQPITTRKSGGERTRKRLEKSALAANSKCQVRQTGDPRASGGNEKSTREKEGRQQGEGVLGPSGCTDAGGGEKKALPDF